jgi:CSLREA domain-containing protein
MLALALLAAPAGAQTFTVNTLQDTSGVECTIEQSCSLRDAIRLANEAQGPDTIAFAVAGTISVGTGPGSEDPVPLPPIESPVTIDGTTAPGYAGAPVLELDGSGLVPGSDGLFVNAGPTTIEGLALGGFDVAVTLEAGTGTQLCGDRLGTDPAGTEARPNRVGVEAGARSVGARIGRECGNVGGNLISGNESAGIVDAGSGTEIAGDLIGPAAAGGALGNGGAGAAAGAGIHVLDGARGTQILPGPGEAGNEIAYNREFGVLVGALASNVRIAGSSIHSNAGAGIEDLAEPPPPAPALTSVAASAGATTVAGTLHGAPGTEYSIELFANAACDASGSGEGQTPIGSGTAHTDAGGAASFSIAGLDALPSGQPVVTATATAAGGSTSEFSNCRSPAGEEPRPPAPPGLLPVNGTSFVVGVVSGTVFVQPPGQPKHQLTGDESIPVGTIVDATHGKVSLTSIDAAGHTQTAIFFGGRFQVFQRPGVALVLLVLRGDGVSACRPRAHGAPRWERSQPAATISRRRGRHLWGSGEGNFRTEGSHGSATVRGTIWFTEDRCDGTFFKVKRGIVTIRDFLKHASLQLPAGHSYLASAG